MKYTNAQKAEIRKDQKALKTLLEKYGKDDIMEYLNKLNEDFQAAIQSPMFKENAAYNNLMNKYWLCGDIPFEAWPEPSDDYENEYRRGKNAFVSYIEFDEESLNRAGNLTIDEFDKLIKKSGIFNDPLWINGKFKYENNSDHIKFSRVKSMDVLDKAFLAYLADPDKDPANGEEKLSWYEKPVKLQNFNYDGELYWGRLNAFAILFNNYIAPILNSHCDVYPDDWFEWTGTYLADDNGEDAWFMFENTFIYDDDNSYNVFEQIGFENNLYVADSYEITERMQDYV